MVVTPMRLCFSIGVTTTTYLRVDPPPRGGPRLLSGTGPGMLASGVPACGHAGMLACWHAGVMPEGDVAWRTARKLDEALSGRMVTRSDFRVPRYATTDLTGRAV